MSTILNLDAWPRNDCFTAPEWPRHRDFHPAPITVLMANERTSNAPD